MAVRAWLETTIPPVFGKEMESFKGRYLKHGYRLFLLPLTPPSPHCLPAGRQGERAKVRER